MTDEIYPEWAVDAHKLHANLASLMSDRRASSKELIRATAATAAHTMLGVMLLLDEHYVLKPKKERQMYLFPM